VMYIFMGYWAGVVEISIDGPDLGGGELAGFIRAGPGRPTCLRRGPGTARRPCRAGPGPIDFVSGRALYRAQISCFGPAHGPRA